MELEEPVGDSQVGAASDTVRAAEETGTQRCHMIQAFTSIQSDINRQQHELIEKARADAEHTLTMIS